MFKKEYICNLLSLYDAKITEDILKLRKLKKIFYIHGAVKRFVHDIFSFHDN